eukprot:TRINITY_DN11580_c0_g1_i1.p1 TRINITY_DN11580_c0_g1~~TRINITY_DN11580_c0_g1_i1.p1  ORF type:complete len:108 (-),score=11.10 TRINITY_DN11580_c0_g1_i1:70-351(-)
MDDGFTQALDQVSSEDVSGVLAVDKNGLCLGTRGCANAAAAGFVRELAHHAQQLGYIHEGDGKPIVCIETAANNVFIKQGKKGTAFAIYRIPK